LNETRGITGDTALRLAHFFGASAQFWLNLQSLYDLRVAEETVGKSIKGLPTVKRRELVHA
jgi:plasmid maintenance system antidote protein VapI